MISRASFAEPVLILSIPAGLIIVIRPGLAGNGSLNTTFPFQIIQGGMGIGVSRWPLARAVSLSGQLGVVSGTSLDVIFSRTLQLGDPGGHLRRALDAFPIRHTAERVLQRHYIPGGKAPDAPFKPIAMFSATPSEAAEDLTVAATFAEIYLAKEGHGHPVGLNLLEKIQVPTLHALYGAMLAGVDVVLMGAGIPRQVPGVLDNFAAQQPAEYRLDVTGGAPDAPVLMKLDPADFARRRCGQPPALRRPAMLAIVTSHVLAENLARKASGHIDGFVVEDPIAGGHNAPPRGPLKLTASGEPLYGPRDAPDFAKFRALGRPFFLAGGYGRPGRLKEALELGASGIQVGTAFACCEESGLQAEIKQQVLQRAQDGDLQIFTDPHASPTGFPFKVANLPGTLADGAIAAAREPVCDIGLLRQTYQRPDGSAGFRCPSEPLSQYVQKGGCGDQTDGRCCICNGLIAAIGLGQIRPSGAVEPAIVTLGNEAVHVHEFLPPGQTTYTAADVVRQLFE